MVTFRTNYADDVIQRLSLKMNHFKAENKNSQAEIKKFRAEYEVFPAQNTNRNRNVLRRFQVAQ